MTPAALNASVVRKIPVADGLFLLHVRPDVGVSRFVPGQYVALGLPSPEDPGKILKRAYSIGSSPETPGHLEFYVAVVPDGALTPLLGSLDEGDRLFCAPKITGTFTLGPVGEGQDVVFVSTGTGIAPFMSMLRTPGALKTGGSVTLLHGVRRRADLAYRDELRDREREEPSFRYVPMVSREDAGEGVGRGYVQTHFEDPSRTPDPDRTHVFLCGNPAMVEAVEGMLVPRGFVVHSKRTPGNLHFEKYW